MTRLSSKRAVIHRRNLMRSLVTQKAVGLKRYRSAQRTWMTSLLQRTRNKGQGTGRATKKTFKQVIPQEQVTFRGIYYGAIARVEEKI